MEGFSSAMQMMRTVIDSLRDPMIGAIGAYFLALVFMISGVVKLWHPQRAAVAIHDFGFGHRSFTLLGFLLGLGEVALAVLLASSVWLAPWLAAFVLWLFAIFIARSLLTGRAFACFCFGSSDTVMSWLTFTRTASLAVLASLLQFVRDTRPGTFALEDRLSQAIIATALMAILVLLARAAHLLQSNRISLHALENPPT